MKKIKYLLLLATIVILLVGVASANEVSKDKTDTNSITKEVTKQNIHKVSDTSNIIQKKKIKKNIQTNKASTNNKEENATKKSSKTTNNTNVKTSASITNWQQLREKVDNSRKTTGNVTITLGKGTYTNNGMIIWQSTNNVLTIDGNGQTINGNQQQAFFIGKGASLVLKNITIINGKKLNVGAIENRGTLTIIQSTLAKNNGIDGGVIHNSGGKLTITQSTLTNNTATDSGGAIYNYGGKITITQSTLTNNKVTNKFSNGGAISNIAGTAIITQSTLSNNTAKIGGGAIYNDGTMRITESSFENNTAPYGGAIRQFKYEYFNVLSSNFTNNNAQEGGAIFARGYANLTDNIFSENKAKNKETIDLSGEKNGLFNANSYESTDISLKNINLSIKDNQTIFTTDENVMLNYSIDLTNSQNYDRDILEKLEDIILYINGEEYTTTKYKNYTLSNLKPGEYAVYYETYNQKSNTVTFNIIEENEIKVTTQDVEMIQGKSVTFRALINYKNTTINNGKVYFEIDGKTLVDENGSILYAPVINNQADLSYNMPTDISLGNHTLTAVYPIGTDTQIRDNKILTIIENIPEGAGQKDESPQEDKKQETYYQNTRNYKKITENTKTIHSTITTKHEIITDNDTIPVSNTITLSTLNEIFNQTFTNGHLLLYIDGELVFNGTTGDDLTTTILEIIEKYRGQHEIKIEFTDKNGKTNTYNKTLTIE